MKQFSDKRLVDIAQSLYIQWLQDISGAIQFTEEQKRYELSETAKVALMAAEEFSKVFAGKEKYE